ncbi:MAG: hypothetical protein XD60_0440 [Acetothermia bacterium 64_32]|nr:MAG: hypothetical protein XD60_0440 [Acetothermia bacterium 64_32]HAF70995.1 hypothetical protein [Candidatus Acetothermia bacterium]
MIAKLLKRARALKKEAYALYIAERDPRTPWYAKLFMGLVVAHALSPIDLIPDFIPILGQLDDLVITPLGVALALKMVPAEVMADARKRAEESLSQGKPISRMGTILVILFWLMVITAVGWSIARAFTG